MNVIITLIDRLSKFEAEMRALPGNMVPKSVARPSLPASLRLKQAELVAAFGAKRPSELSRNVRRAIVVVARVHRGVDSHSIIADKAEVLGNRLAQMHGIVPVTRASSAPVDYAARAAEAEADRVSDMRKLERLADQAERRALREACEKIQPECWKLACQLDCTSECPLLLPGFKAMGTEDLTRLHADLTRARTKFTTEIAARKQRAVDAEIAKVKAKADLAVRCAALKPKFEEAEKMIRSLDDFASSKRVRVQRIVLPAIEKLDDAKLEVIIMKLKSFKLKIEERARELDPRKSRHRISNPSALPSPIASIAA